MKRVKHTDMLNPSRLLKIVLSIAALAAASQAFAQETALQWRLSAGTGYYSFRASGRQGNAIPPGGVALLSGDLVQTGKGRAELALALSGTILKLGDNTSLQIGKNNTAEVTLLYGRIRVIEKSGAKPVLVNAGNATVEISKADAGVDYYIPQASDAQPKFLVHMFSGKAEAEPLKDGIYDLSRLELNANQTTVAEFRIPVSQVERRALDEEAIVYWGIRPEPVVAAAKEEAPPPPPPAPPEPAKPDGDFEKVIRHQKKGMIAGLFFDIAGAALLGTAQIPSLPDKNARLMEYGGFASLGLGTSFILSMALENKTAKYAFTPEQFKAIKDRKIMMGVSAALNILGGALIGTARYADLSDTARLALNISGYVPIGVSQAFLLSMAIRDPKIMRNGSD